MAANSQKPTSKCFAGMLRRLLCTGSLPTHPSDHIMEPNPTELLPEKDSGKKPKMVKVTAPATTPGIVARLMGLDSLPEVNWDAKTTSPDILGRSRSVNSLEYLLQFDRTQAVHRRIRTSVSFREVPTFLNQQQNRDFVVLCLENVDEAKQSKSEMAFGELGQRKSERGKNNVIGRERKRDNKKKKKIPKGKEEIRGVPRKIDLKNGNRGRAKGLRFVVPHNRDVYRKNQLISKAKHPLKSGVQKELSVKSKFAKKKSDEHEFNYIVPKCNLGSSNECSVLGVHNFSRRPEILSPEDSRTTDFNWKMKSLPEITKSDDATPDHELGAAINHRTKEQVKANHHSVDTQYYVELFNKICRLTEEDLERSNWVSRGVLRFEDFEEMCGELGQQIMESLLHQEVDEVLELSL